MSNPIVAMENAATEFVTAAARAADTLGVNVTYYVTVFHPGHGRNAAAVSTPASADRLIRDLVNEIRDDGHTPDGISVRTRCNGVNARTFAIGNHW